MFAEFFSGSTNNPNYVREVNVRQFKKGLNYGSLSQHTDASKNTKAILKCSYAMHTLRGTIFGLHTLRGTIFALHTLRGTIFALHTLRGTIFALHTLRGTIFSHDRLLAEQHPSSRNGGRSSEDGVRLSMLQYN